MSVKDSGDKIFKSPNFFIYSSHRTSENWDFLTKVFISKFF